MDSIQLGRVTLDVEVNDTPDLRRAAAGVAVAALHELETILWLLNTATPLEVAMYLIDQTVENMNFDGLQILESSCAEESSANDEE